MGRACGGITRCLSEGKYDIDEQNINIPIICTVDVNKDENSNNLIYQLRSLKESVLFCFCSNFLKE